MTLGKSLLIAEIGLFVVMFLGVIGHRFQFLPFKVAFGGFALSLLLAALVALVACVVFGLSFGPLASAHRIPALFAVGAGLLPLVCVLLLAGPGFKAPRIHDISTDTENNLTFVHAQNLRRPSENSLAQPTEKVIQLQRDYYSLESLVVEDSVQEAYQRALEVAAELGWQITFRDPASLTFEATEQTAVFGFIDDIVMRISEEGEGAKIDTRSVSRVGVSDLGANAKRIQRFQQTYRQR